MGTARMGSDATTSVTDPHGETHEGAGVWVADASLFPTASGVNPMITVSALAFHVAHQLASRLTSRVASELTYPTDYCNELNW